MGMEVAMTGVPSMVARIAYSTCCNFPEGLNVVSEKEYLPSMFWKVALLVISASLMMNRRFTSSESRIGFVLS